MKDIFIDNDIAKRFSPPLQKPYKELITWLYNEGALVVSQKLLVEYNQGLANLTDMKRNESILGIIGVLIQTGRLNKITNQQLNNYRFKKYIENAFLSNRKDWNHIKTVLLSYRKMAITVDANFHNDINRQPKIDKIKPHATFSPSTINYK